MGSAPADVVDGAGAAALGAGDRKLGAHPARDRLDDRHHGRGDVGRGLGRGASGAAHPGAAELGGRVHPARGRRRPGCARRRRRSVAGRGLAAGGGFQLHGGSVGARHAGEGAVECSDRTRTAHADDHPARPDGVFEPSEEQFRKLLTQVEGLTRLIEDLRTLGLSESGHLLMHIVETDLGEEVRQVTDVYEHALRAAGQRIELDLPPARAHCDPVRIRQVLLALLENARKYAVPGVRVFDAFWRAESSRSRDSGGTGLAWRWCARSPARIAVRRSACPRRWAGRPSSSLGRMVRRF
ncbi:signal transduction histidine-protein kinase BaeS [Ditylenchus destructor]|nr:signal transduction histidine-protein kinase BaeS [Ditylenchus destructor]